MNVYSIEVPLLKLTVMAASKEIASEAAYSVLGAMIRQCGAEGIEVDWDDIVIDQAEPPEALDLEPKP